MIHKNVKFSDFKGTNIKDVVLPESAPSTLLLDKHIAFIISYSKKTDDYVRM